MRKLILDQRDSEFWNISGILEVKYSDGNGVGRV